MKITSDTAVHDFLALLKEGRLSSLDIFNKVDELTDHFNPLKLDFLEKDFLYSVAEEEVKKQRIDKANKDFINVLKSIKENNSPATDMPSLPQIALIFFYEGKVITRENADEIARQFGHKSGDRLYGQFTKLSQHQNRTGGATERRKFLNKIKQIESVVPFLSHNKEAQEQAKKEISEMKKKESEYE